LVVLEVLLDWELCTLLEDNLEAEFLFDTPEFTVALEMAATRFAEGAPALLLAVLDLFELSDPRLELL
jgi:hypothetical protein